MNHVYQWVYQRLDVGAPDTVFTPGGTITLLSNHIIMQIIAMLLLVLLIPTFVRTRNTGDTIDDLTPHGFGNFFESICAYLRDTVARPVLGEHGYLPSPSFSIFLPAATKNKSSPNRISLHKLESVRLRRGNSS